ncbi:CRISPR-associated endonuclease Cas2 [Candidatus Uhrbacteria bacterium]|nr:CRISPR-associated endonuclease Cas2 [Candidatus Uhrbacteria bacterium]
MSIRLELMEFQIALLELQAANMNPDSIHIPGYVRRGQSAIGLGGYRERERRRRLRDRDWLRQRIKHLKDQHYIETVKEGERQLVKLTAKGKYEVLRLQFLMQMRNPDQKKRDGRLWLAMYDVPESKRAHREFFRRLLKQGGFIMLQRSIWISRCDPRPSIDELLKYIGLERFFEVLEVDCKKCSVRFLRKLKI